MKASHLLGALLFGVASISFAQAQESTGRFFQRIDANGDGIISRDEVLAARDRLFSRLDRNGDGAVDQDELDAVRDTIMDAANAAQSRLAVLMQRADANGDGKVTPEEFRSRALVFDLIDRNGDGKLSADEIAFIRGLVTGRRG